MFTTNELVEKKFIPSSGYKIGRKFPEGWVLPSYVSDEDWKKLPLYIQVRYEYEKNVDGTHFLN